MPIVCNGSEGKDFIRSYLKDSNYLMDPHTATCMKSYNTCLKDNLKMVAYLYRGMD